MHPQIEALHAAICRLPLGLAQHVEGMVAEARRLARLHSVEEEQVELAAWGHDIARALSDQELLAAARTFGLEVTPAEEQAPILLHGPVGAEILRRDYGVDDPRVLAAVRLHTIGRAGMSALEKVIFVADKISPDKVRANPALAKVLELAERDLDAAIREYFRQRFWAPPAWARDAADT